MEAFDQLNSKLLYNRAVEVASTIYSKHEASSISFILLEHCFKLSKTDIISNKSVSISQFDYEEFTYALERLSHHEPIQYITCKTTFLNTELYLNPSVLIPRVETEELVQIIIEENKDLENLRILDIGTGSGCIAISLAKNLKNSKVSAIDFDEVTLEMAKINASNNGENIDFILADILTYNNYVNKYDLIVSNPPYVLDSEKEDMDNNVFNFEPHEALFVSDAVPLKFYTSIIDFATQSLIQGGKIYFEINEAMGVLTEATLKASGFKDVEILQDLHGKDRFAKGVY